MTKQDKKLYQMQRDLEKGEHMHYSQDILNKEHYMGTDPRRRQELMDARMIQEDHTAIANMPREFIHSPFRRESGYFGIRTTDEEISKSKPI